MLGKSGLTPREAAISVAIQSGLRTLILGGPGLGKSAGLMALCRSVGRHGETLVGSMMDPTDFKGLPYITKHGEESVVNFAMPGFGQRILDREARGGHSVLLIEELTQGAPAVQNAEMRLVNDREVGDGHLPASTWIVAAANPPGTTGGTVDLNAALANRFLHFHVENDDAGMKIRASRWRKAEWADLSEVVLRPDWDRPENVLAYRDLLGRFLEENPNQLWNEPQDGTPQASGPWPSDRTWEYALLFCAAANYSTIQGEPLPDDVFKEGLAACVGQIPMQAFWNWCEAHVGLTGETLLKDPARIIGPNGVPVPDADMQRAVAQAVDLVAKKPTVIQWNSLWAVFRTLSDHGAAQEAAQHARNLLKDPRVRDSKGGFKFPIPNDPAIQPVLQGLQAMGVLP